MQNPPKIKPFGAKALRAVSESTGFLTVLEGSVRSMKTVTSLVAFMRYVLLSSETVFLMSGNTQGTICRNCIDGDFGFIALSAGTAKKRSDPDGSKYIDWFKNKIYYCGADNARSFEKIRGLTLGGWYADEVNLHNREFVGEALRRSLASTDRRNLWTLNPDVPGHWIYTEYIDRYAKEKTEGFRYFHFTLEDNPAITEARRAEIARQYTGLFYKRYILGLRVRAEGVCYPSFEKETNVVDALPLRSDGRPVQILFCSIGSDIGGSGSATVYTLTGFFNNDAGQLCAIALDEVYDSENKSTESILKNFKDAVSRWKKQYNVVDAYSDSAEQLILKSMRNLAVVNVHNSRKEEIVDRIRCLDAGFSGRRFFILRKCRHLIESVESAVWDMKATKEERLDDGTVNIDSLDSFEYSWERRMRDLVA